jgi:hypothetical protein
MPVYVPNPDGPDPADLIEELGAYLARAYATVEQIMIERVASLLRDAAADDTIDAAVLRLEVIRRLRREGAELANAVLDRDLIERIMQIAAAEGEAAALRALGIGEGIADLSAPLTPQAARAAAAIALDVSSDLAQMQERITRWMPDVYQRAIALIAPSVVLGVETVRQAQARAAAALIARGVRGFVDSAGRQWRIGTYAEMAMRTAVNRAYQEASIAGMQSRGINLVSIIIGSSACARCAAWSGKILSTDGTPAGTYTLQRVDSDGTIQVTVSGTLAQARAGGWNHPNCRCAVVAYLAGLSIATGSRYDPEGEQQRDRQRALERRIRDLKRKQAAALSPEETRRYGRLTRVAQADLRAFLEETGMLRRRYREQLTFSDGTLPALRSAILEIAA